MPPCRTAVEMRSGAIPDSRATIASASSDVWRCCASKSAGTYSASITGVIGSTLRSRTDPFQVCDSVAAVAIAGFARSVSARSIGTRIELNICASLSVIKITYIDKPARPAQSFQASIGLLQKLGTDEQHETSAAECHIGPIVDREIEDRKARRRQVVGECPACGGLAAAIGQC